MRYATFSLPNDPTHRLGAVNDDRMFDVKTFAAAQWPGPFPASLLELIHQGSDAWRRLADLAQNEFLRNKQGGYRLRDIRWHAPIPRPPRNIFCLGQNYAGHAREAAAARGREFKVPDVPIFFTKATTTVNGPYDPVSSYRSLTGQVDWEAELGVVIGTGGTNIRRDAALSHVFGYTVINDVSARDLQVSHKQFFKGKSLDGFCPMGPVIVTADEFGDPQAKEITCRVNGVVKQSGTTTDMIFSVAAIIEWLSQGLTLEPGDIIATGTPEGVGLGRTPPEFLQDRDVLETEVEGIGALRNLIIDISD